MNIQQTHNYDLFSFLEGNRVVNTKRVNQLAQKMMNDNKLRYFPIVVNDTYQIIDGQHRFLAAKANDFPIYYVVKEDGSLKDAQQINTTSKSWTLMDFVNSYAELGYENYKILKDFIEFYKLPVVVSIRLCNSSYADSERPGRKYTIQSFKDGKYIIKTLEEAHRIAELLMRYQKFTSGGVDHSIGFVQAVRYLERKGVNHDRLFKKLEELGTVIKKQLRMRDYLRVLEEVYNHKMREDNKIRFF